MNTNKIKLILGTSKKIVPRLFYIFAFIAFPIYSESIQWSSPIKGDFILTTTIGLFAPPASMSWKSKEGKSYKIKWGTSKVKATISNGLSAIGKVSIGTYGGENEIHFTTIGKWKLWEITLPIPTNGDPPNDYIYLAENDKRVYIFGARGRGLLGIKEEAKSLNVYFVSEPWTSSAANSEGNFKIHHWKMNQKLELNKFYLFGLDGGNELITGNIPCEAIEKAMEVYGWNIERISRNDVVLKSPSKIKKKQLSILSGIIQNDWTKFISHYWTDEFHYYNWAWSNEWHVGTSRKIIPNTNVLSNSMVEFDKEISIAQFDGLKLELFRSINSEEFLELFSPNDGWAILTQDESGSKIRSFIVKPGIGLKLKKESGGFAIVKIKSKYINHCGASVHRR